MTKYDFKVIDVYGKIEFEIEVRKHLNSGWKLAGGVTYHNEYYYIAVYREL